MAITIIIKDGKPRGETRSSIDKELIDVGWGSTFKDEVARDKCEFVERQIKKKVGADSIQVPAVIYNRIG
jgi:hypothetical protein